MTVNVSDLVQTVEWDGNKVRLVELHGLPQRGQGYSKITGRRVRHVIMHQSDGPVKAGAAAPLGIARFHAADPKYKRDADGKIVYRKVGGKMKPKWIGGGRGWPGIGYTFVVPTIPDIVDGKAVVYRCHPDETWSYHTGAGFNKHDVAVCMAGMFSSRHDPHNAHATPAPHPLAVEAMEELVLGYLLPRYGLAPEDGLLGHFDAGKAACPGDFMEQWIRYTRGESYPDPREAYVLGQKHAAPLPTGAQPLQSARERQAALSLLGYDLGPAGVDGVWGNASKGALLAFQDSEDLVVDGRWGPQTEAAMRAALARG